MELFEEVNKELGTEFKSNEEIDWNWIIYRFRLSEQFIEKYKNKLNWYYLVYYQKLSDGFIKKYSMSINWNALSQGQILSVDSMYKWKSFLNLENVARHQLNINEDILKDLALSLKYISLKEIDRLIELYRTHNIFYKNYKNKDWFIVYTLLANPSNKRDTIVTFKGNYSLSEMTNIPYYNIYKLKIYFKDLNSCTSALNYEIIRKVKNRYKI